MTVHDSGQEFAPEPGPPGERGEVDPSGIDDDSERGHAALYATRPDVRRAKNINDVVYLRRSIDASKSRSGGLLVN